MVKHEDSSGDAAPTPLACEVLWMGRADKDLDRRWRDSIQQVVCGAARKLQRPPAFSTLLLIPCGGDWPYTIRWKALEQELRNQTTDLGILVVIFGPTPDDLGDHPGGIVPNLLLQALNADVRAPNAEKPPLLWVSAEDVHKRITAEWARIPIIPKDRLGDASCLYRLYREAAAAEDVRGLFELARDAQEYRIGQLHSIRNREDLDKKKCDITLMEARLGRVRIPRSLKLNVLIVENDFYNWHRSMEADGLYEESNARSPFGDRKMPDATFYLYGKEFDQLLSDLASADGSQLVPNVNELTCTNGRLQVNLPANGQAEKDGKRGLRYADIDLVLLDVWLRERSGASRQEITGLTLAPYFLSACPQALLFLFTAMDVEILAGSGDVDWQYVDGILSKRHLGSLWWQYYQAFRRRFGRMLWQPWCTAKLRSVYPKATFGDRESLRDLFGSLRRWQTEPAILGHGQVVNEMIDHAHRHTLRVWQLVDGFLGELLENVGTRVGYLSTEDRMLLTLATWLHDIGHRGDDFLDDSAEIRKNHAGISEYLLLRNPEAFAVEWLKQYCHEGSCKVSPSGTPESFENWNLSVARRNAKKNRLLTCRNLTGCRSRNTDLCPIRKVGLLCRHHQSNAPLTRDSLKKMLEKGKFPTAYSRSSEPAGEDTGKDSRKELDDWMSVEAPLRGWRGSYVRMLEDFLPSISDGTTKKGDKESTHTFLAMAGLLRMMDALQLESGRVGTTSSVASFEAHLDTRHGWCRREMRRLARRIETVPPGTVMHQDCVARYAALCDYDMQLSLEHIHYWRQMSVKEVVVNWRWHKGGSGFAEVTYLLSLAGLKSLNSMVAKVRQPWDGKSCRMPLRKEVKLKFTDLKKPKKGPLADWYKEVRKLLYDPDTPEIAWWTATVLEEVIISEHKSQDGSTVAPYKGGYYSALLPDSVGFCINVSWPGLDQRYISVPMFLLEPSG